MSKYKPFVLLGPGDSIREELEFYGWDQKDLAEILGVTPKHVNQIINNKVPITLEMATKLSDVFKQSPQFWLNLDTQYRLSLQDNAYCDETVARALIYRYMPVRDMRKKGLLPKENVQLVPAVLKFWNRDDLNFDFIDQQAACFRKSGAFSQFNIFFAITWLQSVRNAVSAKSKLPDYNPLKLRNIAECLADYSTAPEGVKKFIADIAEAGCFFAYVPHLEKTYTDGASFWQGKNPVLAYTCRFDRNDNFWFTVAHELGHILLHDGKDTPVFIDSLDNLDREDKREQKADNFARRVLKIPEILRMFRNAKRISRQRVEDCADLLGLHPAIVVGALQHANRLGYQALNDCRTVVKPDLPGGN